MWEIVYGLVCWSLFSIIHDTDSIKVHITETAELDASNTTLLFLNIQSVISQRILILMPQLASVLPA